MALQVGELFASLGLDVRDFDRGLGQAEAKGRAATGRITADVNKVSGAFDHAGGRLAAMSGGLDRFGQSSMRLGSGLTLGVTAPLVAMAKASVDASADLGESANKASVVFGDAYGDIADFAEDAARSVGMSQQAALDATGTFGNLFTQLDIGHGQAANMSTTMVRLAADFASFHNANRAEVIEAQTAAYRGEYDALQRFVPTINAAAVQQRAMADSGKANAESLTDQEKALATYALMMEGAGKAQGDMGRTMDSLPNKTARATAELANARAELGQHLVPIMSDLVAVTRDAVGWFNDLSPEAQGLIVKIGGLAAAAGPAVVGLGAVARGASSLITVGGQLSRGLSGAAGLAGGLATVGPAAGVAAAGLAVFAVASAEARSNLNDVSREVMGFARTSEAALGNIPDIFNRTQQAAGNLFGPAEEVRAKQLTRAVSDLAAVSPRAALRLLDYAEAQGAVVREGDKFISVQRWARDETVLSASGYASLKASAKALAGEQADLTGATEGVSKKQRAAANAAESMGDAAAGATAELKDERTASERLQDSLADLVQLTVDADRAHLDYREQVATLTKALRDNGSTLDVNTRKGRENRGAVLDTVEAVGRHIQAQADNGASMRRLRGTFNDHIDDFRRTMKAAGFTKDEIVDLIGRYNLTPKQVLTRVRTEGAAAAGAEVDAFRGKLAGVGDTIANLGGSASLSIRAQAAGGNPASGFAFGGTIPGARTGKDDVPIWATAGEYMQPTSAVDYYGVPAMDDIRNRRIPREILGYAAGGRITAAAEFATDLVEKMPPPPAAAYNSGAGGLNPELLRRFNAWDSWAQTNRGVDLGITSGYRSSAQQAVLYARYLAGAGPVAAPPGSSNHERGLAIDYNPASWGLSATAGQFGLHFPVSSEPWHAEMMARGGLVGLARGAYVDRPTAAVLAENGRGEWALPDDRLRTTIRQEMAAAVSGLSQPTRVTRHGGLHVGVMNVYDRTDVDLIAAQVDAAS